MIQHNESKGDSNLELRLDIAIFLLFDIYINIK
jgi:hypothetical protein